MQPEDSSGIIHPAARINVSGDWLVGEVAFHLGEVVWGYESINLGSIEHFVCLVSAATITAVRHTANGWLKYAATPIPVQKKLL